MGKIIVIGAGISGLTAAIYARRSGLEVTLCEQHRIAGGMCTSWKRKDYLFEGAIHWLTGSSPKTKVNKIWRETGALNDQVPVFLHDPFSAVEWEGQTINLYRDIDKTAEQLFALSPPDKNRIRRLVKDVKTMSRFQKPVMDIMGLKAENPQKLTIGELCTIITLIPTFIRLSAISAKDYTRRFIHPGIKRLFHIISSGEYMAIAFIYTLSTINNGDGGYPEGGSLAMIERMVKTFENLGGKLLLNTKVKKVKIEHGAAVGVVLSSKEGDETLLAADAVIVTQDVITAYDQLFDTPPRDRWIKKLRKNTKPVVCTFVSVGIRTKIPETRALMWKLDEPIKYAGKTLTEISFFNYALFEEYMPKNGSVLTCMLRGDTYDFWKKAKEEGRYEEEKRALADQISRAICRKYPQAEGNIEVIDIATPLTYERYTGAYHGSWMEIISAGGRIKKYPGFSKDFSGLYFAGQRIHTPGGLPVALDTGRKAAQLVCRRFGIMFR